MWNTKKIQRAKMSKLKKMKKMTKKNTEKKGRMKKVHKNKMEKTLSHHKRSLNRDQVDKIIRLLLTFRMLIRRRKETDSN